MWMVVILHILNKGALWEHRLRCPQGVKTTLLLDMAAYCAVNCYGLISGYVGAGHRFRYSGAGCPLAADGVLYAAHHGGLCGVPAGQRQRRPGAAGVLPVLFRQYWYVIDYFGMCLFIPFFNLLLERPDPPAGKVLALSLCADLSPLPTLRQGDVF